MSSCDILRDDISDLKPVKSPRKLDTKAQLDGRNISPTITSLWFKKGFELKWMINIARIVGAAPVKIY